MKFILFSLFCLLAVFGKAQCPILPTPSSYIATDGYFYVPDVLLVDVGEMSISHFEYLVQELELRSIKVKASKENADLYFVKKNRNDEFEYDISVEEKIVVNYESSEGEFYAVNSLLQLFVKHDGKDAIQKCKIQDKPRFDWRGLHLDVSRHFFSVEEVKQFLELMALYKFNKFHWHLTDDQGWRIEIKKYPKLTAIGAYRDSTVIGHFSDEPRKYDTEKYGGFYSQEEIKEVVDYARTLSIDVIPEIEMPGHSRAALAAYPEFSCTGELNPAPGLWGIFDDIYCSKKESIDFMKDILSEVLELFPSEYIHIGGDEAPKVRWKECDNCQKIIADNHLKDEHELQSYFIRQIDDFLTSKGRKLIGWDEILEGGLSPNAAVMSWRGEAGGIEAAKQGHNVVMSPTTYCYFDYYQSPHDIEPLAIGGYLPLEKVYKYNPVPAELSAEQEKYILGGQANLWTEYMPTMDHVEYMAFPRALALIQSLWCTNKPDYETFLTTYLKSQESYLELHNVNYAKSIHYPELIISRAENGINIRFVGVEANEEYKISGGYEARFANDLSERTISRDTIGLVRMSGNGDNFIDYSLTSENFDDTLKYRFNLSPDLGRAIKLVTPPHPKYDHNGSLNLVDGVTGGKKFKGTEWLGFRENRIEMIVDTRDSKAISALMIGFKENNGSWIYLPERINIYASKDGVKWKKIKSSEEMSNGRNTFHFKKVKTSYIKLEIETIDLIPEGMGGAGNVPWTFIDEIEFLRIPL